MTKFNYNALANDPNLRPIIRDWVRRTCPLVYLFAPSNTGKTTLLGSLFPKSDDLRSKVKIWTCDHNDYCKVLYLDADQGGTTIEQFVDDERLCDWREFDRAADEQLAWLYEQLEAAETADCNAIVIEGVVSVHGALVAKELRKNPKATGNATRRCYGDVTPHSMSMIQAIRDLKQNRKARRAGVPILVSLNTRTQPVDPKNPSGPERYVPDWSPNLVEKSMRSSDAHLQLQRNDNNTTLVAQKVDGAHPYCKMRSDDVAEAVQREMNLSLPGLFALWALKQDHKKTQVKQALDNAQASTPAE